MGVSPFGAAIWGHATHSLGAGLRLDWTLVAPQVGFEPTLPGLEAGVLGR